MGLRDFLRYRLEAGLRGWRGLPADEWAVRTDAPGFVLTHESYRGFWHKGVSSVAGAWAAVVRAVAYKWDNLTWDTLWLQLELADGALVQMPEEATGWSALVKELPARLPGCLAFEQWWQTVAVPAFAENAVQLYPPPNNSSKPTPLRGAA